MSHYEEILDRLRRPPREIVVQPEPEPDFMSLLVRRIDEQQNMLTELSRQLRYERVAREEQGIALRGLAERLNDLEAGARPKKAKKALPYLETIPVAEVTKLRCELFLNPPKQGVPKYNLKTFVWTCSAEQAASYPEGNIKPFFFWLAPADDVMAEPGSGLEELALMAQGTPALIGAVSHRTKNGVHKGSRKYPNQCAVILEDQQLGLVLDGHQFGPVFPAKLDGERAANASRNIWYPER